MPVLPVRWPGTLLDFYADDYLESHHPVYITFAINVGGSLLLA